MVILDTNIIIDHLRTPKYSILWELTNEYYLDQIGISAITIQELYTGQSTRKRKVEENMTAILSSLEILNYSFEVAQLAGEIRRDPANNIEFPDAAIAATCLLNDAKLATLNKKHFTGIKGLELAF